VKSATYGREIKSCVHSTAQTVETTGIIPCWNVVHVAGAVQGTNLIRHRFSIPERASPGSLAGSPSLLIRPVFRAVRLPPAHRSIL